MVTETQIPKDFKNYEQLILSGNTLLNVKTIVDDKGFIPLLIGKDENHNPLIWLKTKSGNGEVALVKRNESLINIIDVNVYKNEKSLNVVLNDKGEKYLLLEIDYKSNIPNITKIDLRQIGYNIYGDETGLNIGSSLIKKNTFHTDIMIGV